MHSIEGAVQIKLLDFLESRRQQVLLQIEGNNDNAVYNELVQLRSKEENLLDQLMELNKSDPLVKTYHKRLSKITESINELENRLKTENVDNHGRTYYAGDLIDIWDDLSIKEKHIVAAACIDRIFVNDSEIDIVFRFQ